MSLPCLASALARRAAAPEEAGMAAAATSLSGRGPGHGRPPGRRRRRVLLRGTTAVAVGLASLTTPLPASAAPATEPANAGPTVADCPADIADLATCYGGQDVNGAYYAIAVPHEWNGSLVMHAHGGPDLEPEGSDPERSVDDLERWTVMVEEGYAWAEIGRASCRERVQIAVVGLTRRR